MTSDYVIRKALKKKLSSYYNKHKNILILEELGLYHGKVRIDLLAVNHDLHGFEIKSDHDSLKRLPEQARIYSLVFDRVTLVVGYRHAYEALKIIPDWWGVRLVNIGPRGAVRFSNARNPKNNPYPDKLAIIKLLWKEEALAFLEEINTTDGYKSKTRDIIYERIAEITDIESIRNKVHYHFRNRLNWRSREQRKSYGD